MKYVLFLLFAILPLFLIASKGCDLSKKLKVKTDTLAQSITTPLPIVVNPSFGSTDSRPSNKQANPSVHPSFKERYVRCCCVPVFIHCLGALVCCKEYCGQKA